MKDGNGLFRCIAAKLLALNATLKLRKINEKYWAGTFITSVHQLTT